MSAPPEVVIDPAQPTDFFIESETPASIRYKFWLKRDGAVTGIGPETTSDARSDHWIFAPPTLSGSVFGYWLGIWGKANSAWRARVTVLQQAAPGGPWQSRATWTEAGTLSDLGNGLGVDSTDVIKVTLK
jgi:hypothetical protein